MIDNIAELLDRLKITMSSFGDILNGGATESEIDNLNRIFQESFNTVLPDGYTDFLRKINGFSFDGVTLYGVDTEFSTDKYPQSWDSYGCYLMNNTARTDREENRYIFIAENSISWYCYNIEDKEYVLLDNPSGTKMSTFKDFDDMLKHIIYSILY